MADDFSYDVFRSSSTKGRAAVRALLLAMFFLSPLAAQPRVGRGQEPIIHLLVVADTNDKMIGESVKADLDRVQDLFHAHVPAAQLRVEALSGSRVRPGSILQAIRGLTIHPNRDAVVFYYSGHGAFDQQAGEHILQPQRKPLDRKDVRAALRQLRPRLTVLLTDTCSVYIRRAVVGAPPPGPPITRVAPAFKSLFLDPSGLIDISCSKPGEKARGIDSGGYFTMILDGYLRQNAKRGLAWPAILAAINTDMQQFPDAEQTAYMVSRIGGNNDVPPVDSDVAVRPTVGVRFGVVGERTTRSAAVGGVEVTSVVPGYPAARLVNPADGRTYQLVPGRDIITHINGQPVSNRAELYDAVGKSPPQMTVRVYDTRDRSTTEYNVDLSKPAGGGMRFGVSAVRSPRSARVGGVEVTQVFAGYPGMALRSRSNGKTSPLVVGRDVITHINGEAVTSYEEFVAAVKRSPPQMTVRVYDLRAQSTEDYDVTLRN